jgi:hypothetical protein
VYLIIWVLESWLVRIPSKPHSLLLLHLLGRSKGETNSFFQLKMERLINLITFEAKNYGNGDRFE